MKKIFKGFFIILIGVMLVGNLSVMVGEVIAEDDSEAAASGKVVDPDEIIGRESMVNDLAEYWATQSGEPVENLEQLFDNATTEQLIAISQASVYEQVQAALDSLGDTDRDYVFTPVKPCKIVDTRFGGGGFFFPGNARNYTTYGNLGGQGGSNCPSPRGEPRAVHISLGTAFATGTGNIQAYPVGAGVGAGISVNFAAFSAVNFNFINTGPVRTCYLCGPEITISSQFAGTDIVAFVLGYYHEVDRNDADRLALAYAHVNDTGGAITIPHRTENVSSVTWNAGSGRYEITISGVNYFFTNYTTVVSPARSTTTSDVILSTSSVSGRLLVYPRDEDTNTAKRGNFAFVVYKDQ